jgi:beta-1,4-N-acetylglucosaminyltransferase
LNVKLDDNRFEGIGETKDRNSISDPMKVALICSIGGHLTEMMRLMDAFEGHDIFFVTHQSPRTELIDERKYFIKELGNNWLRVFLSIITFMKIFMSERPSVIVSTGSEIAIPAFYAAKLLKIPSIFIESWCCVYNTTGAGRLVYPVSDVFLVQWPSLVEKYGSKAKFKGGVI